MMLPLLLFVEGPSELALFGTDPISPILLILHFCCILFIMSTITFDTYAFVKRLKAAGFNDQQAEALSTAQKESLAEALDTTLATKLDIARLEGEMKLMKWMLGLVIAGIATLILKAFFV